MTMHMAHPSLSLQGKKRGKQKFRNAEEARKSRELDSSWAELQKKWGVEAEERKRKRAMSAEPLQYSLSAPAGRTTTSNIKSLDTGHSGAVSSKPIPQYTGTKMLGVGTMHKSNAVPIFSDEDAKQISSMRR
jgi:hypothetical protein